MDNPSSACPRCADVVQEGSRRCPACGLELLKACPFCAEDIPAAARACRWCRSDLDSHVGMEIRDPSPLERRRAETVGEERGMLAVLLLGLATLGIHSFFTMHQQLREIAAHEGKPGGPDPGRDTAIAALSWLLTCGLLPAGIYWVLYRYPKALQETCLEEEIPCRDVMTPALLVALGELSVRFTLLALGAGTGHPGCCLVVGLLALVPTWPISIAVVQNELNKHWAVHRSLAKVRG